MDELTQLISIHDDKIEFLEHFQHRYAGKLKQVVDIDGALHHLHGVHKSLEKDLRESRAVLDVVSILPLPRTSKVIIDERKLFQYKTLESNELATIAESRNSAIYIFTIVTVIFLPLSFFTSYFGMNIQGIANTNKTQSDFWAICGTLTVAIVGSTIILAARHWIHAFLHLLFLRFVSFSDRITFAGHTSTSQCIYPAKEKRRSFMPEAV